MTWLAPQGGDIPRPVPTPASEPFWAGCRQGELRFLRCGSCGGATHGPALLCATCAGRDLTWQRATGRGEVASWTVVWRPQTPAFVAPYVPIVVDLEEGWLMLSNLVGCEHDAVHVGLPVQVVFHPLAEGVVLPYFEPRAGA